MCLNKCMQSTEVCKIFIASANPTVQLVLVGRQNFRFRKFAAATSARSKHTGSPSFLLGLVHLFKGGRRTFVFRRKPLPIRRFRKVSGAHKIKQSRRHYRNTSKMWNNYVPLRG